MVKVKDSERATVPEDVFQKALKSAFIDPLTDFGFKKLFGNKKVLIPFLNELLQGECHVIADIEYVKTEQLGKQPEDRRVVFDIHCRTDKGSRIVIEMQNGRPLHFEDRALFYSTFPLQSQAPLRKTGKRKKEAKTWNYRLNPVYVVSVLNFNLFKEKEAREFVIEWVQLVRMKANRVFSEKLKFVFIELPKFKKELDDLTTLMDCYLYSLKHIEDFKERPAALNHEVFDLMFEILRKDKLNSEEMETYKKSMKDCYEALGYYDMVRKASRRKELKLQATVNRVERERERERAERERAERERERVERERERAERERDHERAERERAERRIAELMRLLNERTGESD
ncbi:MAG: Rpn family recombination-promoting nuclease/putative transposase [Bacteroidales bacterium]|jgi:predicted transposase/invertase (TIGR01784 family)|nr:Rpn family recombination-promoting nuclease/putative transposase [Bacteroidales bacterium]